MSADPVPPPVIHRTASTMLIIMPIFLLSTTRTVSFMRARINTRAAVALLSQYIRNVKDLSSLYIC